MVMVHGCIAYLVCFRHYFCVLYMCKNSHNLSPGIEGVRVHTRLATPLHSLPPIGLVIPIKGNKEVNFKNQ